MNKLEKDIITAANDSSRSLVNTLAELAIRLKGNDKKAPEDFMKHQQVYFLRV